MKVKHFLLLVILFYCSSAKSQVCTGSLGDPAVHISFGSGINPGAPLPPGSTSYLYRSTDCPAQGEYSIWNFTFTCFSDSWHTVPFDHTPNDGNNGYYMEVNAGPPGDFFVKNITGLCPNTTYEFAFWVMNVSKSAACGDNAIDPDIAYSVENNSGTMLAIKQTGDITEKAQPTWEQYSLSFKTEPGATSVTIRLTSKALHGCGNDFLIDDITLRPCGPAIHATVGAGALTAGGCEGDAAPYILNAVVGTGFTTPNYQWQQSINSGSTWTDIPGANNNTYILNSPAAGIFQYRVLVAEAINFGSPQCRLNSNAITITIEKAPFGQGTNYSYCLGQDAKLFAAGGISYLWKGPNGFTSNLQSPVLQNITFKDSGLYTVEVTSLQGCKATDSTRMFIFGNPIAFASSDIAICEGKGTTLSASGGTDYYWQPATGLSSAIIVNPIASPVKTTTYVVTVSRNGCFDTASLTVTVWAKPVANAGPDRKMRKEQSVSLLGAVGGTDISYSWSPALYMNNTTVLSPIVSPPQNMKYTLHVQSNKGCGTVTDDVLVRVYDKINVPNAFSPNGDGINDTWVIDPLDIFDDSETQVYNRYGQIVFSSRGYATPWNGKRNGKTLPTGTYYYTIDLKNNTALLTGWVIIVK